MLDRASLERDGVRLAHIDWGGTGSSVLLLHGLAGHAAEWAQTAGWLSAHHHIVALDARGHGHSERCPRDVSRAAHVADTACLVEQLGLAPCVVVGQSMGGLTAILLAAAHPQLVAALIVAEAAPAAPDEATIENLERSLSRWPVPFPSRDAAVEFFGGPSLNADAWADGLQQREDGWWPRFDLAVMARTLREAPPGSFEPEWQRVRCPTLIVRAANGTLDAETATRMHEQLPGSRLVEIADAGHDLHLDQPAAWQHAVETFLATLA